MHPPSLGDIRVLLGASQLSPDLQSRVTANKFTIYSPFGSWKSSLS